jgi:excisionase family DNA binding protein
MKHIQIENITAEEFKELLRQAIKEEVEAQNTKPMTRDEVAEFLNVKPVTIKKWTQEGKLPAFYIGGKTYYKQSEVLSALQRKEPLHGWGQSGENSNPDSFVFS